MKLSGHIVTVTGAILLLCVARGFASDSDGMAHNPFARPAPRPNVTAGPFVTGAPMFRLRATMSAGADSLVNIDGRIVAIGDVVGGFRLVAVGEGTAVFTRDGVRYPLTVSRTEGDQG